MKKIPTLFVRDPENRKYVTPEVTPGCEWVLAGEGIPTRKYDGTCVMYDGEQWWARREVKPGKEPPSGWVEVDHDEMTGKRVGWEPAAQSGFARWIVEASAGGWEPERGTYELCGPKVNGNPEGFAKHRLIAHADAEVGPIWAGKPIFGLAARHMPASRWEGIVWHHPDGRMAKLKRRDFPQESA